MATSDVTRRSVMWTLTSGAIGAATSTLWVESLGALSRQQAHTHAADAAIAAQDWTPRVLDAAQNETVVALTELIIPQTDTPGAKEARVNRFIDNVLHEAAPDARQKFLDGLAWLDRRAQTQGGKSFLAAGTEAQTALLTRLADENNKAADDRPGVEFFQVVKGMTIDGYYTSEIGLHQELGDDGVLFMPTYVGCTHPEHQ